MGSLSVNLKVSMSRNYGNTTVTFELTQENVQFDGQTIAADLLTAGIIRDFNHFEEQTLKQLGKTAKPAVQYNELKVIASKLYVHMEKGKKGWRVMCGKWTQHGVPIYSEHLQKSGINPDEIPEDGFSFPFGTECIVQLENGEPKRVLNIVQIKHE